MEPDEVPEEWRERITEAITRHCRRIGTFTVAAAADAVVPLFADEAEHARQAEDVIERIGELCEQPYTAAYDLAADIRAEISESRRAQHPPREAQEGV